MALKEPGLRGSLRNVSVGIGAIPDFVESQYQFEDETDTTTAIDAVSGNNLSLSDVTFDSTSKCGNFALSISTDSEGVSESSVDLSALGDDNGLAVGGFFRPNNADQTIDMWSWGNPDGSANFVCVGIEENGNWRAISFLNSDFQDAVTNVSADTGSYAAVWARLNTDGELSCVVDGVVEATTNTGHDPTDFGSQNYHIHRVDDRSYDGLVDNGTYISKHPTVDELADLESLC